LADNQQSRHWPLPGGADAGRRLWQTALREPFLLFLAVSAVIFALYWMTTGRPERIEVSSDIQRSLADDYVMMTGRAPDAKARTKLVDDYVTDEILFREAIRRGMHVTDKTTRQRLVDRIRFMIAGAPSEPDEETLVNHYSENPQLYRSEPRISLEHVFFERTPADPAGMLAQLRSGARIAGDEYWMGRTLPNYGESMLRGMFGPGFLDAARKAPVGSWIGPVSSSRGVHFVKVTGTGKPALMPYPVVRDQVRQDYLTSASGGLVAAEVKTLEKGYAVDVAR
jgi:peptidyl-prolyl cis-trans isomerase C